MFKKKKSPIENGFKPMLFKRFNGDAFVAYDRIYEAWKACRSTYSLDEIQMLDGTKIPCHNNWPTPDWLVMVNYARDNTSGGMWVPEDYEPPR